MAKPIRKEVEERAREYLSTLDDGKILSTRELVSALGLDEPPSKVARALIKLALDNDRVSDICERGEPVEATSGFKKGQMIRPCFWSKPEQPTQEEVDREARIKAAFAKLDKRLKEIFAEMEPTQQELSDSIDKINWNISYKPRK
jgi:hypothetical protein